MSAMGLRIYAGRTFHLPTPGSTKLHLYIAVTNPDGDPEKVVIVNLTTRRNHSDPTVALNVGDHEFIKHETVVNYVDALFAPVSAIQEAIKTGKSTFHDDCSDELLERIQQGLLVSPRTKKPVKAHCKKHFDL